jgi:hypothetical protein
VKSGEILVCRFERCEVNKPNHRHRRLLRAGGNRPSRRAAKRKYEFSPSDLDFQVTLRGGHAHAIEGRYHASIAWSVTTFALEGQPKTYGNSQTGEYVLRPGLGRNPNPSAAIAMPAICGIDPFLSSPDRDRLITNGLEGMTDATAAVHRRAWRRGGMAARGVGAATRPHGAGRRSDGVHENDPDATAQLSGFTQGLAELGWIDGRNLRMDVRKVLGAGAVPGEEEPNPANVAGGQSGAGAATPSIEPPDGPAAPLNCEGCPADAPETPVDWKDLVACALAAGPEPAVLGETFIGILPGGSRARSIKCSDGHVYAVKGQQVGRAISNDCIAANLAALIGAPVPPSAIVEMRQELISTSPELAHFAAGTAHGSRIMEDCRDGGGIEHVDTGANRKRFASLAIFNGWLSHNDRQFLYHKTSPFTVYSADHGHFFPGGPNWSVASLQQAGPAVADQDIVNACQLTADDLRQACEPLKAVKPEQIAQALASAPIQWGVTADEREELAAYLAKRRSELVSTHIPEPPAAS